MEIRAALGRHFVGFNTGRWDYINSVADAMAWDRDFVNPNIDSITMTYGYMRNYEDRVRRAVQHAGHIWAIRVLAGRDGAEHSGRLGQWVSRPAMKRAVAGAEREQREGASGKWVAHWKMVHIVRPVWERSRAGQSAWTPFPPLTYSPAEATDYCVSSPLPRTVRGARDLLSVGLQYGNAFGQGCRRRLSSRPTSSAMTMCFI